MDRHKPILASNRRGDPGLRSAGPVPLQVGHEGYQADPPVPDPPAGARARPRGWPPSTGRSPSTRRPGRTRRSSRRPTPTSLTSRPPVSGQEPDAGRLGSGGWARFDDSPGWAAAVLEVAGDVLAVTGPAGSPFCEGALKSSQAWQDTARRQGVPLALAGAISSPLDIEGAQRRGEMFALLCPVMLAWGGVGEGAPNACRIRAGRYGDECRRIRSRSVLRPSGPGPGRELSHRHLPVVPWPVRFRRLLTRVPGGH